MQRRAPQRDSGRVTGWPGDRAMDDAAALDSFAERFPHSADVLEPMDLHTRGRKRTWTCADPGTTYAQQPHTRGRDCAGKATYPG
jgi:hypothetical protein